MIRPEAKRALWRWREVLFGITIAALGYLWVISYFGLLRWLGIVLFIIGPWMLRIIVTFTQRLFMDIPGLVG